MQMKVYRKKDKDQAIGYDSSNITIRKGTAFRKLKKGTVIPISMIDDVTDYIKDYTEKLKQDGFVYAGTVDVTDEEPYPIMKNEVCIHWSYDASAEADPIKARYDVMVDATHAAELLSDAEHCSAQPAASIVVLNENGKEWSIGFSNECDVFIPESGIQGGDISTDAGIAPYLLMMHLAKKHPLLISLANSHAEELVPDLISSAEKLPFDVNENVKRVGELLDLCIAPVNWKTVGKSQQASQDWFF